MTLYACCIIAEQQVASLRSCLLKALFCLAFFLHSFTVPYQPHMWRMWPGGARRHDHKSCHSIHQPSTTRWPRVRVLLLPAAANPPNGMCMCLPHRLHRLKPQSSRVSPKRSGSDLTLLLSSKPLRDNQRMGCPNLMEQAIKFNEQCPLLGMEFLGGKLSTNNSGESISTHSHRSMTFRWTTGTM